MPRKVEPVKGRCSADREWKSKPLRLHPWTFQRKVEEVLVLPKEAKQGVEVPPPNLREARQLSELHQREGRTDFEREKVVSETLEDELCIVRHAVKPSLVAP